MFRNGSTSISSIYVWRFCSSRSISAGTYLYIIACIKDKYYKNKEKKDNVED